MTDTSTDEAIRPWWDRLTPRAGIRIQLFSASVAWLVGLGFLLVRGVGFLQRPGPGFVLVHWFAALVALAIVLGMLKARYILIRYANKSVARIRSRGRACYFGFFSWSSWAFIVVMMGGGIMLRHSVLATGHFAWGRPLLAVIYIAVGTALAIADRIFWVAAFSPIEATETRIAT
jgi:hypothetical protein